MTIAKKIRIALWALVSPVIILIGVPLVLFFLFVALFIDATESIFSFMMGSDEEFMPMTRDLWNDLSEGFEGTMSFLKEFMELNKE